MAQSYMLVILAEGRVYASERRKFSDLPDSALPGISRFPDGSISDKDALVIVNGWNRKSLDGSSLYPVRFLYYI